MNGQSDAARVRAEHLRDKAEQLLQRAQRSTDPAEAERLRHEAKKLQDQTEPVLRHEPGPEIGDLREEYPE
ncbi:DUF6381 family protein [Streptomyces sp. NPDC002577]